MIFGKLCDISNRSMGVHYSMCDILNFRNFDPDRSLLYERLAVRDTESWHTGLDPEEAAKGLSQEYVTILSKSSFRPFKCTGRSVSDFSS